MVDQKELANIMNNNLINSTKTSNPKTLDKGQVHKETFENHISMKK